MVYCERCERSFSPHGYDLHRRDSQRHWLCEEHDKDFETWTGLKEHYVQSPYHFYCQRCNEHFGSRTGLLSHLERNHFYCKEHRLIFNNALGLKEHYVQHGDHFYCQYCDMHFSDEDDFLDHGDEEHFTCRTCVKVFPTKAKQEEHFESYHHYCKPCARLFNSLSNLEHHLESSIHKPRTFACPGRNCNRAFVSVSALILHAESGTCPSGVTRQKVNEHVVRMDRTNAITNPNRLITSGGGGYSAPSETRTYATAQAWNGTAYECFLCYKEFRTLQALNNHLASPVHQSRIYRCPNGACGTEFSALSGLSQHVERGSCGVQRFRQVRDIMDSIQSGMRAITI